MRNIVAGLLIFTAMAASSSECRAESSFLMRGYRPGHIFGNSVRAMVWGPSMGPSRGTVASSRGYNSGYNNYGSYRSYGQR